MAGSIGLAQTSTNRADFSPMNRSPYGPLNQEETYYYNVNFTKYYGIYRELAKVKNTLNTYASWVTGQGFETDDTTKANLDLIRGNGTDSFQSIIWNMLVIKKANGDSYAQVVRNDKGTLINIIPLNPEFIRHVGNRNGKIIRYDYMTLGGLDLKSKDNTILFSLQPNEILHFCNDRVVNELGGTAVTEALKWNVEASEEAKRVLRKLTWRSGVVRIIEVDTSNQTELDKLKIQWKDAEEKGTVMFLPKDAARAVDFKQNLDYAGILAFIEYLDNDFYETCGVPRSAMGGVTGTTEAGAKTGAVMFDPIYQREVTELQEDLWQQLGLRITWIPQNSMMDNMQQNEQANTGQTKLEAQGAQ